MTKHTLFAILFSSWIFGISLICLFPPVPDYYTPDQNSSSLNQVTLQEIHQRNCSQASISLLDFGFELHDVLPLFDADQQFRALTKFQSIRVLNQICSFFDTKILFKVFFETW